MTIEVEAMNAIERTRNFLRIVVLGGKYKRVPKQLREDARGLLKHYPGVAFGKFVW